MLTEAWAVKSPSSGKGVRTADNLHLKRHTKTGCFGFTKKKVWCKIINYM